MKVVLFGSTGGTGKNVISKALAAGHQVVAVARKPEAVTARHERLEVKAGDVLKLDTVAAALDGADAVISTIGPTDEKNPGTLLSQGVGNIVVAMQQKKVARFVFESGLMMSDGSDLGLLSRLGTRLVGSVLRKAMHDDKAIAEATILSSPLDWVIVRCPVLKHVPGTGRYVAGPRMRVNALASLPHEDAADCLVRALSETAWTKQIVNAGAN